MLIQTVRKKYSPSFYNELESAFQETDAKSALDILFGLYGKPMYSGRHKDLMWRGVIVLDSFDMYEEHYKKWNFDESESAIEEPVLSIIDPLYNPLMNFLPRDNVYTSTFRAGLFVVRHKLTWDGSYYSAQIPKLIFIKKDMAYKPFSFSLESLDSSIKVTSLEMQCFSTIGKFKHGTEDINCNVGGCGKIFPEIPLDADMHPRNCECGGLLHLNIPNVSEAGVRCRYDRLVGCDKCRKVIAVRRK